MVIGHSAQSCCDDTGARHQRRTSFCGWRVVPQLSGRCQCLRVRRRHEVGIDRIHPTTFPIQLAAPCLYEHRAKMGPRIGPTRSGAISRLRREKSLRAMTSDAPRAIKYSMTACCGRLTQPEKSRQKKAKGGGNGSMARACPRGWPNSRSDIVGRRWAEFPEAQPRWDYGDPPNIGQSDLGGAFAHHGVSSGRAARRAE